MELEILKILYDYTKERKVIDIYAIEKIISLVVNERNLSNYVKKLDISEELSGDSIATYDFNKKDLNVYIEKLHIYFSSMKKPSDIKNYEEIYFYKNSQIIRVILHELEHAYENKYMNENKTTYASLMILVIELLKIYPEKYDITYSLNPLERNANIYSQDTIKKVTSYVKKIYSKTYSFQEDLLRFFLANGYQKNRIGEINYPTELYLRKHELSSIWQNLSFYDKDAKKSVETAQNEYDLFTRVLMGFPISNEEYDNLSLSTIKKIKRI